MRRNRCATNDPKVIAAYPRPPTKRKPSARDWRSGGREPGSFIEMLFRLYLGGRKGPRLSNYASVVMPGALSRASTPFLAISTTRNVDGRDKPGHDGLGGVGDAPEIPPPACSRFRGLRAAYGQDRGA